MTAVTHNIEDMAVPLRQSIADSIPNITFDFQATALVPPRPIIQDAESSPQSTANWPHHQVAEEDILALLENEEDRVEGVAEPTIESQIERDIPVKETANGLIGNKAAAEEDLANAKDDWGIDDDFDIPDIKEAAPVQTTAAQMTDVAYQGQNLIHKTVKNSQLAGEQIACGFFDAAIDLLKKQIAAVNFTPYRKIFANYFAASAVAISGTPFVSAAEHQPARIGTNNKPMVPISVGTLEAFLKRAYGFFTEAKFNESLDLFREILLLIPLLVVKDQKEEREAQELLRLCIEYIVALRAEVSRKALAPNEAQRSLELSFIMCLCNLQPKHRILALRAGMALAYKTSNFVYAGYLAKKIVQIEEQNPNSTKPDVVANAKKVYAACEQQGTNAITLDIEESMLYDNDVVLRICPKSLKVLKTRDIKKCAFTNVNYAAQYAGEVCEVSLVSKIGVETLGMKVVS
eukprot:TRINITY_DN2082_c0_g1_i4.p1 TRINITY_DN2082_c0_g1~~TRINITY_DN2082_c0_g1_i4.p1  ORF type:complete len:461 (-),score=149.11 TRINITY_DN2082_c0_g1_i4:314-1696(-)